jgi:TATA-binding protein-associated factor
MSREGVNGVLKVLLQLLTQNEWEARHGGLLGLKYLLAVREVTVLVGITCNELRFIHTS